MKDLLFVLSFGAVAGFLAGLIMKSRGTILRNILLGLGGGVLGGVVTDLLGFAAFNLPGKLVVAVVGSCVLIFIVDKIF